MNKNIKQYVTENQMVSFKFYREGSLWYEAGKGLIFEIPVSETGNGTYNVQEKAINMMKFISKQLDKNDKARMEMQGE